MKTCYTIGQLARAAGVPTSTVRFYERAGLLQPCRRTTGDYRLYDEAALARLRFIRAARASGFTVKDIAGLLPLRDRGRESDPARCRREVQGVIRERLQELDARLAGLRCVQVTLQSLLEKCLAARETAGCPVLEELEVAPSTAAPPNGISALDLEPRFKG